MTEIGAELATFVREAKPNSSDYYKTAQDRLRVSFAHPDGLDSDSYLRFKVNLPRREEVASLYLDVFMEEGESLGGGILLAQLMKINGPTYQRYTWNNLPAVAPGVSERDGTLSGRRIRWDVTDLYGELTLEDGSVSPWMSFRIRRRNDGGTTWLVGPKNGRFAPRLVLTTQPKEFDPTDLRPVGITSVPKPVFEWTAPLEISHRQVQVDELGGDFSSPLYDSGEVAVVGQIRNRITAPTVSGPAWSGIPVDGASVRVRHRKQGSSLSDWVEGEVFYVPKEAPVLLGPDAEDADPTPPIVWDLAADSVRVLVTRENRVVEDVLVPGPVTSYTPKKGARTPGEVVRREVRWFDDVDRVVSNGDLPWVTLVQDTIWSPTDTVAGLDSLLVYQDGETPLVIAEAARDDLPDEVWFGWDGDEGTYVDGVDELTVRDWTVPPNTDIDYTARAVVNGEHSEVTSTAAIRTRVTGVWLVDPATERGFVLAGVDGLQVVSGEVAVVNEPISAASLIRRTLMLRDEAGTITGQFSDWPGRTLEEQRADALWMRERTERVYRLICGDLNIPVTVTLGKPIFDAQASLAERLLHNISFEFSHAGEDE